MASLDAIFKAYDIRGLVPDELDADLCWKIGAAFAAYAAAPEILVARDMRPSGQALVEAFAAGANSQGVSIVNKTVPDGMMAFRAGGSDLAFAPRPNDLLNEYFRL